MDKLPMDLLCAWRLREEAIFKTIHPVVEELRRLNSVNAELLHWMKYIQAQTHLAHIHDTASAAIAKAQKKGQP